MVMYKSQIFVSKRDGIYILDKKSNQLSRFHNGINPQRMEDSAFTKLVVHKNRLYAAGLFNGIFCLEDERQKWIPLNNGLTDTSFLT